MVEIFVEGTHCVRLLPMLASKNIMLKNIKRREGGVSFQVQQHHQAAVVDFFENKWYNVRVKVCGTLGVVQFAKNRMVLVLALAVCFFALCVASNFVWRVQYVCPAQLDKSQLALAASQSGIKVGRLSSSISVDKVENEILLKLPEASFVAISVTGSTVVVKAYAKEQEEGILDLTKPRDIVSNFDGVVGKLTVLNGTARVAVGDSVVKGQVLIEGVREFADGSSQQVCAVGEAFGTVQQVGVASFENTSLVLTKTGKRKNLFNVSFLALDGSEQNTTEGNEQSSLEENQADTNGKKFFEHEIVEREIFSLFPLNIKFEVVTVYEATAEVQQNDLEDSLQSLQQKALDKALMQHGAINYTSVQYQTVQKDGGADILAVVDFEVKISMYA